MDYTPVVCVTEEGLNLKRHLWWKINVSICKCLKKNLQRYSWESESADLMQTHAGGKWNVSPVYTVYMYTSASYIFIHSSAWRWDRSASLLVLVMKTAIDIQSKQPAATLSDNSAQRRRLYVSPANRRVTGQPLFWVWIWLIGSLLTQAFIMPNRQRTELDMGTAIIRVWSSAHNTRTFFEPIWDMVSTLWGHI